MHVALVTALFAIAELSQALPSENGLYPRAATAYCTANKNPGSGSICGGVGQLSTPDQVDTATYGPGYATQSSSSITAEQCREKCKAYARAYDYSTCESFSFDTAAKTCKFYNSTLSEQGFTSNASSTTTFNDASCFKCPSCVPNLLNGNWETGNTSPWIVFFPSDTGIAPGDKSKSSIGFAGHGKTSVNGVEQYILACANTAYTLEFDYKYTLSSDHTNGAGYLSLVVSPLASESGAYEKNIYLHHKQPGVWHHGSVPFTTGSFTQYGLGMFAGLNANNVSATYYYDNIVISLAS